ncbi:MAG: NAD-dependent malic enzyme [Acidobacteriota bacterium]
MSQPPPMAQYRVTLRLEVPHTPGWIARVTSLIASSGGAIAAIDLVHIRKGRSLRDYSIECVSMDQARRIVNSLRENSSIRVHSVSDDTFRMHLGGKLEITSKVALRNRADLSMAYTPGVARICEAIQADERAAFNLTIRKNCIAIISDGSAVLGLGNIGAAAALPVMEGKAILFKEFAGVDAFPLVLATQDPARIVDFCRQVAPTFGGINLEDISSPRCFTIERELRKELEIPVFHDDQHGTAVVVLAGFLNALRVTGRKAQEMKVVVAGAGAAGIACARILCGAGVRRLVVCDSKGALHRKRKIGKNPVKRWALESTNPEQEEGSLKEVLRGADMFLGVSAPGVLCREDIQNMARQPIVFAMANPDPEIAPEEMEGLDAILATGRSDYPNQINNVLAFPGIFRGALDCRATGVNETMKQAAAGAISAAVKDDELSPEYIVPGVFDRRIAPAVAAAVAEAARTTGVARDATEPLDLYPV